MFAVMFSTGATHYRHITVYRKLWRTSTDEKHWNQFGGYVQQAFITPAIWTCGLHDLKILLLVYTDILRLTSWITSIWKSLNLQDN